MPSPGGEGAERSEADEGWRAVDGSLLRRLFRKRPETVPLHPNLRIAKHTAPDFPDSLFVPGHIKVHAHCSAENHPAPQQVLLYDNKNPRYSFRRNIAGEKEQGNASESHTTGDVLLWSCSFSDFENICVVFPIVPLN